MYPDSHLNTRTMNRVLRHRLRNLCAGVKMTMDRIIKVTGTTFPDMTARCDVVKAELDNLEEFTCRMDLLFDKLPAGEPKNLFEVVTEIRSTVSKKYPFCSIDLNGPEAEVVFQHGSLLLVALKEIALNAGESANAVDNGSVAISWNHDDSGGFSFTIANSGSNIPQDIPIDPPEPFNTLRSRHDGLGMAIAYRICAILEGKLSVVNDEKDMVSVCLTIPKKECRHE